MSIPFNRDAMVRALVGFLRASCERESDMEDVAQRVHAVVSTHDASCPAHPDYNGVCTCRRRS